MNALQSFAVITACCVASAAGVGLPAVAVAQVVADSACPKYAVDIASFATCDGDRVARSTGVSELTPARAHDLKRRYGSAVLFIDVRSRFAATLQGTADGVDYVVPYREIAQPLRWDRWHGTLALEPNPDFLRQVESLVRARPDGAVTPVILLCATGETAAEAALALRGLGLEQLFVVAGGVDGAELAPGWRAEGLPMLERPGERQLLGLRR
jgi:rhodanese-related sulfurtransferase